MSNLNLMVGDWVKRNEIDFPFKVKEILKDKIVTTTLVYGVNVEILNEHIQPIPLTPELLEKIEGIIVYEFDNGQFNQYCLDERSFVIRDGVIVDYGSSLTLLHLHTLQQLIRLFTNKEIEVKWGN